jgi:hypothetical protein
MRRVRPVLEHAIDRGQLPAGADSAAIVTAIAAPLFFRALVSMDPVTEQDGDVAAAAALTAARAGIFAADSRAA